MPIEDELKEISEHLENISDGIKFRPEFEFFLKVGHILISNLFDDEKLMVIKLIYKMTAWPNTLISNKHKELLERIMKED